ncbi:unnamed protein product [Ceratitis capitata]|uniref:(Mediterranean fruit fly) hypothetical protein n=1 Tax=Ceratitis capitata TaxID=7213 RepID=A0A811UQJ4_CERCA|nr:unnamed protein product [Ceratitis capitata]
MVFGKGKNRILFSQRKSIIQLEQRLVRLSMTNNLDQQKNFKGRFLHTLLWAMTTLNGTFLQLSGGRAKVHGIERVTAASFYNQLDYRKSLTTKFNFLHSMASQFHNQPSKTAGIKIDSKLN